MNKDFKRISVSVRTTKQRVVSALLWSLTTVLCTIFGGFLAVFFGGVSMNWPAIIIWSLLSGVLSGITAYNRRYDVKRY